MFDIEQVKSQFKEVIKYSQNIPEPKVDALFDKWLEAKQDFITLMGDNLIYEYPEKVSFDLGSKERKVRVNDFVGLVDGRYDNLALAAFIEEMQDGFFSNTVTRDYKAPDGRLITKGTKLLRAFKHFEDNEEALTDIQNHASRIIQEDKIEGRLCISVHPLDFLSSSENTNNWRSCHALDGDYRSGNLSYMVDKCTFMCYLKSDKDEILPNFPFAWNSKKWRVLLYLSTDKNMIMAGRQYPFAADTGLNFILETLMQASGITADNYCWTPWHKELITEFPFLENKENDREREGYFFFDQAYVPVGSELVKLKELVKDLPGSKHFNDLLHSSCYKPMYAYRQYGERYHRYFSRETGKSRANTTKFEIGGAVPCLYCGKGEIEVSESMMCRHCEADHGTVENDDFGFCDCCGRHLYVDDGYWVNDVLICEQCFQHETTECEECGEVIYNADATFNRFINKTICPDCQEEYYEKLRLEGC